MGELLHIYGLSSVETWTLNIGKPGVPTISDYNALAQTSTESPLSLMRLTYGTNFPGLSNQSKPEKHLSRLFRSISLNLNNCCLFYLFLLFCNPPCFVLCLFYVQDPQVRLAQVPMRHFLFQRKILSIYGNSTGGHWLVSQATPFTAKGVRVWLARLDTGLVIFHPPPSLVENTFYPTSIT